MPSRSASEPTLGEPGSVWVWRGASTVAQKHKKEECPTNEAAAVSWKAARKPTLYGQLGTYNKISTVIQYPASSKDPHNMCQGSRHHLSAEDRRLMRVMIKHALRHSPHYPQAVYEVERKLIGGFGKNPHLKAAFFTNIEFAQKTLVQMAVTVDTHGQGKDDDYEAPLNLEGEAKLVPGKHHYACGPQCYCNKFQDAALMVKGRENPGDFVDTFANKTKFAATALVDNLAASRRKRASATSKACQ